MDIDRVTEKRDSSGPDAQPVICQSGYNALAA